ncbi:MAG TPA: sporulation protein YqfC [Firmicutes bacterium]|nr:sporulation protein YqfC [Bacillota bacterium]
MKRKKPGETGKRWHETMADFFELPRELLFNLPRVTLVGNVHFYLENYGGIIEYNEETVRLKVKEGEIVIRGENLSIKNFYTDEIFIEGKIKLVEYR